MTPALIGFDWGTTNLRAALLDADGEVIEQRTDVSGVGQSSEREFEDRFGNTVRGWPDDVPVLMAGMVGSSVGWHDAGYVDAPASVGALIAGLHRFEHENRRIRIVPGIRIEGDAPDVMRGEETQIAGLLARRPHFDGVVVLPGTHSKWARVKGGAIESYRTYMTGELFQAIGNHTILARSIDAQGAPDNAAFVTAFERACHASSSVWGQLFSIRAASVLQGLSPTEARERLSGFLVGAEFFAARSDGLLDENAPDRLAVMGTGSLVDRYRLAFEHLGIETMAYQGTALVWRALALFAREAVTQTGATA